MRIGNLLEVTTRPDRLALAAAPKPNTEERGTSGVAPSWGGDIMFGPETDANEKWRPPERWTTVSDMLTDPDISAALDAVLLPVLAAVPSVEPGVDDPRAHEIADFVAADIAAGKTGWFDTRY